MLVDSVPDQGVGLLVDLVVGLLVASMPDQGVGAVKLELGYTQ
jgi:hypothetical protein